MNTVFLLPGSEFFSILIRAGLILHFSLKTHKNGPDEKAFLL